MLRTQVAFMKAKLVDLQSKWARQLPDGRTLAAAQLSARRKRENDRVKTTRSQLQELFQQQQLMQASLQSAICRAPLQSIGMEILTELHFNTRLGREPDDRGALLKAHYARATATLSPIVDKFTQAALDRRQAQTSSKKPVLPVSQIDITGGKDCTLVSSVFVSEIPHNSLEDVYAGALAYFDAIPTSLKRHLNMEATRTRVNSVDEPAAYWRMCLNDGVGWPATVNHVVCAELTPSHGLVHVDAVTDDPLYPSSPTEFSLCGLKLTPRCDPATGRTVSVTLRRVVLYCYNMLPADPAVRANLEVVRPVLNGDLITASVCSYIQEVLQQRSPQQ
jgi:hypothetical protein